MNRLNKKQKFLTAAFAIFLVAILTGVTYAFFTFDANKTNQTVDLTAGTMKLVFDDNDSGISAALKFGETKTKKFTIQNTGTREAYAKIQWKDYNNSYMLRSLTYTLEYSTSLNGEYTTLIDEAMMPSTGGVTFEKIDMSDSMEIPANTTYYYNLLITLKDHADLDQTADLNATFNSHFKIVQDTKNVVAYNADDTLNKLMTTATNALAPYGRTVSDTSNILAQTEDFYGKSYYFKNLSPNVTTLQMGNYPLQVDSSVFNEPTYTANYYEETCNESTTTTWETGEFSNESECSSTYDNCTCDWQEGEQEVCEPEEVNCWDEDAYDGYSESEGTIISDVSSSECEEACASYEDCTCNMNGGSINVCDEQTCTNETYSYYECSYSYEESDGTQECTYDLATSTDLTYDECDGLINSDNVYCDESEHLCSCEEETQSTGENIDVNLTMLWKIIRINGDGSLRLAFFTFRNTIGISMESIVRGFITNYNYDNNDNALVGYSYGDLNASSYANAHSNVNRSLIQQKNNELFEAVMQANPNLLNKLSDTYFCNDRSLTNGSGYAQNTTYYGIAGRQSSGEPSLMCETRNDRFTVKDTTTGNGALIYPTGLLTADELVVTNYQNIIIDNIIIPTMTPAYYNSTSKIVGLTSEGLSAFDTNSNFVTVGVINLSAKYIKDIKFDVPKNYWVLDL